MRKPALLLLSLVVMVNALGARAQEEGERKKTTGTFRRLEAGDRACYVDLLDEQGNEFHELADFEICSHDDILGKRVRLFYEQANVLAASCEGDVDCGRTDGVVLIRRVELLRPHVSAVATLCLAEERVVFSCNTTNNKVVSSEIGPDLFARANIPTDPNAYDFEIP